ncbi:hypothetical protein [Sodalis sp.]|uniref:hypothetical protein n=1 Tax=Sodalis sp. (in: enterobacteria) TaxID=1898979 RepID=UPI003872B26B
MSYPLAGNRALLQLVSRVPALREDPDVILLGKLRNARQQPAGVMAQQLVKRQWRIGLFKLLTMTPTGRYLIRERKIHLLPGLQMGCQRSRSQHSPAAS